MNKKIKAMMLQMQCILLVALTACTRVQVTEVSSYEENGDLDEVVMTLSDVTRDGCTVFVENNSDFRLVNLGRFYVELRKNDSWYTLAYSRYTKDSPPYPSSCYLIEPESDLEDGIPIDFVSVYGRLPKGSYRLILPVEVELEFSEYDAVLTAEFRIE